MKTRHVLRYYCDHCGRGHWKKPLCLAHEKRCFDNPKREPFEGELYPFPDVTEGAYPDAPFTWPRYERGRGGDIGAMKTLGGWEPYDEDPLERDEDDRFFVYQDKGTWHPLDADYWERYRKSGYRQDPVCGESF